MPRRDDLEFLLDFDGAVFAFEAGYWIKIKARLVAPDVSRPHGVDYSLTLHDHTGRRILGFDNAHPVSRGKRKSAGNDHWHRAEDDTGRVYEFTDGHGLIADFFREAERVLKERGVDFKSAVRKDGGKA